MAGNWPAYPPLVAPGLSHGFYSPTHQERLYLLQALAAQESRIEQLTNSLGAAKTKLNAAASGEMCPLELRRLKKNLRGVSIRRMRAQKQEKALTNSLNVLTQRMEIAERRQWRKASAEYAQQAQHNTLVSVTNEFQNLGIVPSAAPGPFLQTQNGVFSPGTPGFLGLRAIAEACGPTSRFSIPAAAVLYAQVDCSGLQATTSLHIPPHTGARDHLDLAAVPWRSKVFSPCSLTYDADTDTQDRDGVAVSEPADDLDEASARTTSINQPETMYLSSSAGNNVKGKSHRDGRDG